ncbi:MAG: M23 family metallopeptidase [Myxococcota bacterium]
MRLIVWVLLIGLAGGLTGYLFTRFETDVPKISTRTSVQWIGGEHRHEVRISDQGTGLESVRIWLEMAGAEYDIEAARYAGGLLGGADLNVPRLIEAVIDPLALGLSDGRATLHVEATDYSWIGNVAHESVPLMIDTRTPRIQLETGLTYVRRGGTELVVYTVDEDTQRDGVVLGDHFFPGFPHPSDPEKRVAFYAIPPDTPPDSLPSLLAADQAGNETSVAVRIEVIERSFPEDSLGLNEDFMRAKVTEIAGKAPALTSEEAEDLLNAYLSINRDTRAENEATIAEVCSDSSEDRIWHGPFLQLPNSSVGSRFGARRTYRFGDREVDRQVHLGYDLASTSQAPVPAANDGVVVFADELGIYGNMVILDHGLGLFSMYGHLSNLGVEKGTLVSRGDELGHTGTTGLAGGDHLHFSMLVSGVFVDPLEWFDPKWIQEHIEVKFEISGS